MSDTSKLFEDMEDIYAPTLDVVSFYEELERTGQILRQISPTGSFGVPQNKGDMIYNGKEGSKI